LNCSEFELNDDSCSKVLEAAMCHSLVCGSLDTCHELEEVRN